MEDTDLKNRKLVVILILVLLVSTVLISYGINYMRAITTLRQFSKLIKQEEINDISLTIHYMSPFIFTFFPITIEGLVNGNEQFKTVIVGSDFEEHIDLFMQMGNATVVPAWKKTPYMDIRIYYVFTSEEKGKLFDVAMWGIDENIFINGIEVRENAVFYDVIMPYLPEDEAQQLVEYIGRGN